MAEEEGAFSVPKFIAEVVYVLKGVYKIERDEIGRTLIDSWMKLQWRIRMLSVRHNHYFQKYLWMIARHKVLGDEIVSFDKKLNMML